MKFLEWQYYPKWHLSYVKNQNSYADRAWWEYWIIIGPIQTRWRSKSWCTHLKRSPEWIAQQKEWLLKELETMKHVKVIKDF